MNSKIANAVTSPVKKKKKKKRQEKKDILITVH